MVSIHTYLTTEQRDYTMNGKLFEQLAVAMGGKPGDGFKVIDDKHNYIRLSTIGC